MICSSIGEESDTSSAASSSPLAEMSSPRAGVGSVEAEDGKEERRVPLTEAELFLQCEEKLAKKKESIAFIKSQLMESPEENVRL